MKKRKVLVARNGARYSARTGRKLKAANLKPINRDKLEVTLKQLKRGHSLVTSLEATLLPLRKKFIKLGELMDRHETLSQSDATWVEERYRDLEILFSALRDLDDEYRGLI